jgi:hypothetical protein
VYQWKDGINSRLLELMSRGTAAGVTYTTTVLLLPASLRRIAWRGGGCPIVRPQIVTVERSHMHELLSFSPAWRRAWAVGVINTTAAAIYMLILA